MAQILQGAGGTPVLDEDMLEKMRASGKAYAVEGEDPRIIQAGSVGNATIPMAQYITGTGPEIDLGYTYEPYIPEDKIADLIAEQEQEEGDGSSDESDSDGPPELGEPGYEEWKMYNAGPDNNPHDNPYSVNDMISHGTYTTAANLYDNLSGIPGVIGTGFGSIADNMNDNIDAYYDGVGEAAPSQDNPDGSTSAPSGATAGDWGYWNSGGKIKKYGYGGPVAEQEDPYAAMPVAKPAPMAPLQGALAANQVNSQYQKPWYQQMGQDAGTAVMSNILMKGASMLIPGLNKGGKVCSCGTPGCPGCGKGYNHGGPISAGGYKQKIAMAESAAKIKREDMKAFADVYKKMKGPLQQGE
jgi:hypothetical protein